MSKISTIYDSIIAKLGEILPSPRIRLSNAYDIEDNPYQFSRNGWGLRHDGYERRSFDLCKRRESHSFTVVLTREVPRIETRSDNMDAPIKLLLEDAKIVRDTFYSPDLIDVPEIMQLDVTNVTGIQSVIGEKYNLLKIEISLVVDYFELIT